MTIHPTPPTDRLASIVSVVVTYQPTAILLDHLRRLSGQGAEIIVVDNGSNGAAAECVAAAEKLPGVCLIRNEANLGIATALNIGIRRALQSDCRWIATFDQDTAIPADYFKRLTDACELCPRANEVGMIVPGGWAETGAAAMPISLRQPTWSFVQGAVGSGSLIRADVFRQVGLFDDALFIDYVDTDFCLRVQKAGQKILSVASVVLEHELGEKQTRHLFVFKISFRIHTAWRYYYIMRNRLVLYRRHIKFAPLWVLHDARWLILELGRIFFLEHRRQLKLHAVIQGLKDGLRGRTGRHPDFPTKHT